MHKNQIEEIDSRLFENLTNLKALWLFGNRLIEIDRKCFEPLESIEVIELTENVGLNAFSFVKSSTKLCYDKDIDEKYRKRSQCDPGIL